MAKRGRHTEGFTLAELLMSVAIVLILAAIAFPSIVSAQNNMRMLELNNAAQSIANAAQAQMTAKKVSGTWVDAVKDGDSYRRMFHVKHPRARPAHRAKRNMFHVKHSGPTRLLLPPLLLRSLPNVT